MAISLGELELKVKANIDEVKSQIQSLEGKDVDVTLTVETSGLSEAESKIQTLEQNTHTVKVGAETDETVASVQTETDNLGGDRTATAKATEDESVGTTKQTVDTLGGDRTATAKATGDQSLSDVKTTVDSLQTTKTATINTAGDAVTNLDSAAADIVTIDAGATAELAISEEGASTVSSLSEAATNTTTIDGGATAELSITDNDNASETLSTAAANLADIGSGATATIATSGTGATELADAAADIPQINAGATAAIATSGTGASELSTAADDITTIATGATADITVTEDGLSDISAAASELHSIAGDITTTVSVSDPGNTLDTAAEDAANLKTNLNEIPESVDVTATVTQEVTATLTGVDGTSLSALSTSAEGFKTAANTMKDTQTPFQKAVSDFKSHVDELKTNFSSFSGAVTTLGGWVGNFISGVWSFGEKVFDFVLSNAQQADDYMTMATITGMSYKEIQYAYWLKDLTDVSPEQIMRSSRDVTTQREKIETLTTDEIKNKVTVEDKWKDSDVYKYSGLSYEEASKMSSYEITMAMARGISELPEDEWHTAATTAFGSRGEYMLPLVKSMAEGAYDELVQGFEDTSVMELASSDEVGTELVKVKDNLNKLENTWDALTTVIAYLASPAANALLEEVNDFLLKASEIVMDENLTPEEKGQQIWELIKGTLGNIWDRISEWVEGIWEKLKPILETLWYAISDALVEALSNLWLNVVRNMTTAQRKLFGVELTGYEANERNIIFGKDTDINSQAWYNQRYHLGASNTEKVTENMAEYLNDYFGENFLADGTPAQAKFDELLEASDNLGAFIDAVVSTDWTQYYETTADKLKRQRVETREREATEKAAAEQQAAEAAAAAEEAAAAAEQAASDAAAAAETAANSEVKMDVNVENNISIRGNDVVVEGVGTSTEVEEYKKKKAATHQYSSAAAHATGNY